MKRRLLIVLLFLIGGIYYFNNSVSTSKFEIPIPGSTSNPPSTSKPKSTTFGGVFEGITPCSNVKRPLPQIPENAECEMAIWHITFNPDFTYVLTVSYGMSQPNTTGIRGGGTKINMEGNWTIAEGIRENPGASILQLNTDNPQLSVSFVKVSDNIIHLLDTDKNMMAGNGGWAYTLNRTSGLITDDTDLTSYPAALPATGVYEGRTPCKDFLAEFSQMPREDCIKIKWKLTLNPVKYFLQTTRGTSEGTWNIDGNAVILKSDDQRQTISLLVIDDNHLFFLDQNKHILTGDKLWSFTLSRVAE